MADFARLARLLEGSVHVDEATRRACARDGSIYQVVPMAVVRPQSTHDVAALMDFAAREGAFLHARGAASGRAGGAVGPGIVVDFTGMTGIGQAEAGAIRVQPGAVYADVNRALAVAGRQFAPDPSSGAFCTIGGMVGNNASGPHTLRFGSTRDNLSDLEVVLADGSVIRTAQSRELRGTVHHVLAPHAAALAASAPAVTKCSSGYDLCGAWSGGAIDPTRLLCGSEGTLGLVTGAWLRTEPLPPAVGTAVAFFAGLADALAAAPLLVEAECAAVEVMDDVLLDLVRRYEPDVARPVPEAAAALLIVELFGETDREVAARLADLRTRLRARAEGFLGLEAARDAAHAEALWEIRRASSPLLETFPGTEVLHVVEDVAVPLDRLAEFAGGQKRIFADHGLVAAFFGHAGNGNLHLDPLVDTQRPDLEALITSLMEQTHAWVLRCGGVITAEHGDGILRTPWVARQFPHLATAFRDVKAALDPDGRLNPGKIVATRPDAPDLRSLRFQALRPAPAPAWTARRRHARAR